MKYLPIEKDDILEVIVDCDEWGYGNKATCHLIAERLTDRLSEQGIDAKAYYQDFISLAHSMNSGRNFYEIEVRSWNLTQNYSIYPIKTL